MAQTLQTNIVINATSNGFGEIGNTLSVLGAQIDEISQHLINFGKESIKVYEDYEKNMAEARVALSTIYGRNTKELNDVMTGLDAAATQWASSTVFHTDDVSNAITEAARAGWDYNQIMSGIPVAMELAQAGSIDLSDALYYITEAAKAGGIAFEDLGSFVDMWAYAANSSNGSIASFGDTMLKLGSVMNFTDSKEELLSLIAIMHDTGTEGSTAATLLRTAMMNILAPSGTAGKVLEQLGATDDEINEIRQDASKLEALEILGEHGFSAFDENGQAKSILDIFSQLRTVLGEIAGSEDLIDSNETTLGILGTLFGKRGITGALNIMNMMEQAVALRDQLLGGEAEGYGEYAAGTMMDTLYGSIETWESKVEKLKQKTGEVLSEQVEGVLETVGSIVDNISSLDTGTFNALVAGLEVIAFAGPGLMLAGSAFRFLAYALTPAGGIGLGLVALAAAAAAIHELEEADFASKFGDMELDASGIQNYVQQLGDDFNKAYEKVNQFAQALNDAVTAYTEASSTFKSSLISDMLTDVEIKEGSEEYAKLTGLGESMISAVQSGIESNYEMNKQSILKSFVGGSDAIQLDDPIWAQIMSVIEQGYQQEIDRANELAAQLRAAMTSAFSDGHLTPEEIANIQSIMDEQNALLAKQQEREYYLERQRILRKAQTLGLDAIKEGSALAEKERNAEWEGLMDQQEGVKFDTEAYYDEAIKNGWMVPNTDGTPGEHAATEADKAAAMARLEKEQAEERYAWTGRFGDYLMGLWTEGITSSDLSGAWSALEQLATDFRMAGGMVTQDAANLFNSQVGPRESVQLQEYLSSMVEALGGYETLQGYADYFASHGDQEMAQRYQMIMDMYDAMGHGPTQVSPQVGTQGQGDYSGIAGTYQQIETLLKGAYGQNTTMTPEALSSYMQEQRGMGLEPDWQSYLGDELWSQFNAAAQASGFGNISDMIENAIPDNAEMKVTPEVDEDAIDTNLEPVPLPIEPYVEGTDALQSLQDQGVDVTVDGDTADLEATIDGADGQTLLEYVTGDNSDLEMSITSQDGKTLLEHVHGEASHLASVISKYDGKTITVHIHGVKDFASGGRATEASIFGEAGPEWAIPEQHTQNTAELLDAARAASGFTWPELIARNGGLNANPNNTPVTVVYSPTIYAQNAEGVEEKLAQDKARLEKWFAEKNLKDRLEVYA